MNQSSKHYHLVTDSQWMKEKDNIVETLGELGFGIKIVPTEVW